MSNLNQPSVGTILKSVRLQTKLTQEGLARALGVSDGQLISNWERGVSKPSPKSYAKIARFIGGTVTKC